MRDVVWGMCEIVQYITVLFTREEIERERKKGGRCYDVWHEFIPLILKFKKPITTDAKKRERER